MCRFLKSSLLAIMLVAVFSVAAYAAKVTICHVPPGNPENIHEITVSENALQAHLNHGDFQGSCHDYCAYLCDDGDACTQDYIFDADTEDCECLAAPLPAVDCDDDNLCTVDSCDSGTGACIYDSDFMNGEPCDDGDPDTSNDVCTNGVCAGTSGVICEAPYGSCVESFNCPDYDIDPERICPDNKVCCKWD